MLGMHAWKRVGWREHLKGGWEHWMLALTIDSSLYCFVGQLMPGEINLLCKPSSYLAIFYSLRNSRNKDMHFCSQYIF